MPHVLDRILPRLSAARMDADLAAGRPPEASPRHAAHARRLVTPRTRHALAASWEHLLSTAHDPTGSLSNRAPIRRDRLQRAEPEIRELIAALRATGPIPARGVAIAKRLLTDGSGPVYHAKAPDNLAATAALAVENLNPSLPLTHGLTEPSPGPTASPGRARPQRR